MGMPRGSNTSSNSCARLVVPLVLWGRNCPSHTVTAMALSLDQTVLLTGSGEGQLCLWDVDVTRDAQQILPKMMFYGHTGALTSIVASGHNRFISADDNGELCLWDSEDYHCLESKKSAALVHTSMQVYKFGSRNSYSVLCNGNYPEIHVLNAESLDIMYSLVARVHPDWINAFCALKPLKRRDDVILAVTNSGTIKMWTVNTQASLHIYEDESKQIRCVDAMTIRCCPYNQRTVLIVCSKYWQIYDAGEFSLLCNENSNKDSHWKGGDFIGIDKVLVWDAGGRSFIYKLPTNSNPEHRDYHHLVGTKALQHASPTLSCVITSGDIQVGPTPSLFICTQLHNELNYILLRADFASSIHCWMISRDSVSDKPTTDTHISELQSTRSLSLEEIWQRTKPAGLLDQVQTLATDENSVVTCSLYIESSGRLIAGNSCGDVLIVPVLRTASNLLLSSNKRKMPMCRVLKGHKSRVNCLLYPHAVEPRYNPNHLLSGGSDFSVCLWDLSTGSLVHTFYMHAGEVTAFYIPPANCNSRVLSCICSVAKDHSVALISLKEKRSLVFASRHMFPVQAIKWRPIEDFMIISCTDSTAYIWQMETGLLDRVVHGVTAVEMLKACDEATLRVGVGDNPSQISIAQALKRRNLATFRNLAQQAMQGIENLVDEDDGSADQDNDLSADGDDDHDGAVGSLPDHIRLPVTRQPLMVRSLKTSKSRFHDADAHVLFFDTEALILELLSGEPGVPSLTQQLTQAYNRSKDTALSAVTGESAKQQTYSKETETTERQDTFPMLVAQTVLSLIHAWTLDSHLDTLCLKTLGLERLEQPVLFGLISGNGHTAFMLPRLRLEQGTSQQTSCESETKYWEVSCALTTQHVLSMLSLTNTLMSMTNATFIKQRGGKRRRASEVDSGFDVHSSEEMTKQSQIKQSWSLLAALHCVLLPGLISGPGYKSPRLHLLANRWQDRYLEVREAAQALLLAELRRIRDAGRKALIRDWAPFMPNLVDDSNGSICLAEPEYEVVSNTGDEPHLKRVKGEKRKLEATAIVMLGVIGAEFGSDLLDSNDVKSSSSLHSLPLTLHTSKALSYLLLNPVECKLSKNAPLRRAAIDLLGRGFPVWQPYIDVSAVLLGLLELCEDADRIIPSNIHTGLPLSAAADACRTARHALSLIATAQPATFLTCMAKEVARYNAHAAAQSAQSGTHLQSSVLTRSKAEILRVIENLIDKLPNNVADLLLETMDVAVHCLDANRLKQFGLRDTFPALCKFSMISYCTHSRRICVGSKNGTIAFYEIKQSKSQSIPFQASPTAAMIFYLKPSTKEMIHAHDGPVGAASFSADGKYLSSYSPSDSKVNFWQTSSSSLFGSQHTKCVKSYSVPWKAPTGTETINTRAGRLVWSDSRTVSLILPDSTESRYRI